MGKNLIQQRRGKGSTTYKAPSFRYKGAVKHSKSTDIKGKIIDIVYCPGHSAPLAQVLYENGEEALMIVPEGLKAGDFVSSGAKSSIKPGNTIPLKNIPEGTLVYNIESLPGDRGKFIRASGTFGKVLSKVDNNVVVKLPSKKEKVFNSNCRANIGVVAGGGRKEKPFLKAGKRYHAMRAKNKLYPIVSGVSMNAVDHPFGGTSSHSKGRPTQAPRDTAPGRKVGKIAPKKTGRKKR